jgi:hypothetical protein
VIKSDQIRVTKFGNSSTFSSVAKAQARHLSARDAAKKKMCTRVRQPDYRTFQ